MHTVLFMCVATAWPADKCRLFGSGWPMQCQACLLCAGPINSLDIEVFTKKVVASQSDLGAANQVHWPATVVERRLMSEAANYL